MNFSFNEDLAVDFSLEESMFLTQLEILLFKTQAEREGFFDESYWVSFSPDGLARFFPFWKKAELDKIMAKSVKNDLLKIAHHTEDGRMWFAFTEKTRKYFGSIPIKTGE